MKKHFLSAEGAKIVANAITAKKRKKDWQPAKLQFNATLEEAIASLSHKSAKELRIIWIEIFGNKAPKWNKAFLIPRLAYRMQEL